MLRARIIIIASDGQNHRKIARSLDINRQLARLWRNRIGKQRSGELI
ncbi:hypothetical protein [uncultured Nostoc sp.]